MFAHPRQRGAQQEQPGLGTSWYDWETDDSEHGGLLSYVDVLSVILAMLVVLLGRMAIENLPAGAMVEPPALYRDAPDSAPPTIATIEPESAPPPPQQPRPSREQRFTELVEQRFQGEVKAVRHAKGVSLEIAEVVLFESARAVLQPSALPVLGRLAATLTEVGEALIAVEGHTDSRPLRGGKFSSNWELAAARANAVTDFLLEQGFDARRLRAVSFADTRPAASNQTVDGRAANRRVQLRVEFLPD